MGEMESVEGIQTSIAADVAACCDIADEESMVDSRRLSDERVGRWRDSRGNGKRSECGGRVESGVNCDIQRRHKA